MVNVGKYTSPTDLMDMGPLQKRAKKPPFQPSPWTKVYALHPKKEPMAGSHENVTFGYR